MVSLLISCELLLCAFNVKVRSLNWLLEFQMRMWYYLSILLSFQFFLFYAFNVKVWSLNWLLEFQMRMWYYLSILLSFQFFLFYAFNVKVWSLNWLLEFQMRMSYYLSILLSFQFFSAKFLLQREYVPGLSKVSDQLSQLHGF
jgi:hypothetical protein